MIDSYVFLTPILMIGVVALVVFVGCDRVFGLDRVDPKVPFLKAKAGDNRVDLEWPVDGAAGEFFVKRSEVPDMEVKIATVDGALNTYPDLNVNNGTTYYYKVSAIGDDGETADSNEEMATPSSDATIAFISDYTAGTDALAAGFYGMLIQVKSANLKIKELGRLALAGNSQTHILKFVDAATGMDFGAPVAVSMAGAPADDFKYAGIPDSSPIILQANTAYYVLSQESNPGDRFLNHNTTVTTETDATITGAGRSNGASYIMDAAGALSYGLVNFKYQVM